MRSGKARVSGFTLTEGVIAMGLGTILFAFLYSGLAWGMATVHSTRANLRATQILVKRAEAIRLSPFEQVTNTTYNPATFTDYFDPSKQTNGGGGTVYNGTLSAAIPPAGTIPDAYRSNMLLVTFSVSWSAGKLPHTRSLQTYVAQNGLQSYISTGR